MSTTTYTPAPGDTVRVPATVDAIGHQHRETMDVTSVGCGLVTACLNDGPFAGADVAEPIDGTTWEQVL